MNPYPGDGLRCAARFVAAVAAATALLSSVGPAHAAPVFVQEPVAAPQLGTVWVSHVLPDRTGVVVSDNFTLAEPALITRLTWRGAYLGPNFTQGVENSAYWMLWIRSGVAQPEPGGWLDFPVVDRVNRQVTPGGASIGGNSVDLYDFEYILPNALSLPAGSFWLTVMSGPADLLPDSRFVWSEGRPRGTSLLQRLDGGPFVGDPPFSSVAGNRAFGLFDANAVPEPSTLALTLMALAITGGTLRRRSHL